MTTVDITNLRSVREALGKSQHDLAGLLGVSLRAVQSYEQGWRHTPLDVQKLALLLLYLQRRNGDPPRPPCWVTRGCDPKARNACSSHEFGGGHFCWLFSSATQRCKATPEGTDSSLSTCVRCPVMNDWLTA
jgi:DNA-binding XRE family transcriptional regulator